MPKFRHNIVQFICAVFEIESFLGLVMPFVFCIHSDALHEVKLHILFTFYLRFIFFIFIFHILFIFYLSKLHIYIVQRW